MTGGPPTGGDIGEGVAAATPFAADSNSLMCGGGDLTGRSPGGGDAGGGENGAAPVGGDGADAFGAPGAGDSSVFGASGASIFTSSFVTAAADAGAVPVEEDSGFEGAAEATSPSPGAGTFAPFSIKRSM